MPTSKKQAINTNGWSGGKEYNSMALSKEQLSRKNKVDKSPNSSSDYTWNMNINHMVSLSKHLKNQGLTTKLAKKNLKRAKAKIQSSQDEKHTL